MGDLPLKSDWSYGNFEKDQKVKEKSWGIYWEHHGIQRMTYSRKLLRELQNKYNVGDVVSRE